MSKIITLDGLRDYLTNLKRLFVTKTDAESTYATKAENNAKANNSAVVHKSGDETVAGTKTFSKLIVGSVTGSSGSCTGNAATATTATTAKACTGNAATATKATQDSAGQQINTTYIKDLAVSGRTITYTKGDGSTGTITTGASLLPIGSYIQFAGSQAPAGFLVCNGGEISRTTYSALFAVIGTTYGSGDGSTTFNLPNLTDRFLQGSTTSGTVKNAGLPNITGTVDIGQTDRAAAGSYTNGCLSVTASTQSGFYRSNDPIISTANKININASRSSSIYGNSTTVQPPALTCLICIKY